MLTLIYSLVLTFLLILFFLFLGILVFMQVDRDESRYKRYTIEKGNRPSK